ncbi:MAG: hypothetical protein KBE09_03535 [Candidatus Pacebacteria bacterium]|nr:hypothetical protein [Candidatus Paceibacterota bacterium]
MNIFEARNGSLALSVQGKLAAVLILAVLFWATGAPAFLNSANAAALTFVSDTLTDSDLSVASGHTFRFINAGNLLNDVGGADTIVVTFDPSGSAFQITDLDATDFVGESGVSVVATGACTVAASELQVSTTTESFTLTICTGDSVATSTSIVLPIASSTSIITNPGVAQSHVIRIQTLNQGTTVLDAADTRVAIIDDVLVTASVDTRFIFTISGLPDATTVNGDATSTTTSATAISYGTLTPGTPIIAGQELTVETNARNGFSVTVKADGNLVSSTGADIDAFAQGLGQATPIAWVAPTNTLGSEDTYGHFGITSEDSTLSTGDPFGTQLYAGDFGTTTREVFFHNGPSDGSTADIGLTQVAYQIEIESLQEAGTDYSTTLTYVATPIF